MAMMLAAVLTKPGHFDVREVPVPSIGASDALIKVDRCGICGTDLHIYNGHYAGEFLPLIPGHEFVGTIEGTGNDVGHLKVGSKVVVDMNIGCGSCYWCRRNEVLNCPEMQQIGITRDGAFAEYVVVPARQVITAPADMEDAVLALTEPLACVVRAARKAQVSFGQSVVVIGAGPIGNLHVQLLRTIGAAPIIVADLSQERLAMAIAAGGDVGVSDRSGLKLAVFEATDGRGADVVIESVGLPELYDEAMGLMRKGGHLAAFGITGPRAVLHLNILDTILHETSLKGSVAGMGQDMHDALTLLRHKRIQTSAFTREARPLADIQAAFESISSRPGDLKTQIVIGAGGV